MFAGQKREERRKLIAHTFHVQLLNEQFQQTFSEKSKQLVDFIKLNATEGGNEAGTTVLEMHSIFTQLTLDILCGKIQLEKGHYLRLTNLIVSDSC